MDALLCHEIFDVGEIFPLKYFFDFCFKSFLAGFMEIYFYVVLLVDIFFLHEIDHH